MVKRENIVSSQGARDFSLPSLIIPATAATTIHSTTTTSTGTHPDVTAQSSLMHWPTVSVGPSRGKCIYSLCC